MSQEELKIEFRGEDGFNSSVLDSPKDRGFTAKPHNQQHASILLF
jgi:hypothetical protein